MTSNKIATELVTSSDGSTIYAEAVGDPTHPALVLVPGYTLSTMVFDKQFHDPRLRNELYMESTFFSPYPKPLNTYRYV